MLDESVSIESSGPVHPEAGTPESIEVAVIEAVSATARA